MYTPPSFRAPSCLTKTSVSCSVRMALECKPAPAGLQSTGVAAPCEFVWISCDHRDSEGGAAEAAAPLVRALADSETEVRRAAVDALGEIGGREVASPLIGRLDDEAATVRHEAAERLMDLGDRQAVIPLLERFGDANKE